MSILAVSIRMVCVSLGPWLSIHSITSMTRYSPLYLLSWSGVRISPCQGPWCNLPRWYLAPFVINRPYFNGRWLVNDHFSAESFFLDRELRNAPNARTRSACKRLLLLFAWWCRHVDFFIDLPYWPTRCWEKFFFAALTSVSCVDLVVGWHDGCCKIWTTWRQAASFMSRLVGFIN